MPAHTVLHTDSRLILYKTALNDTSGKDSELYTRILKKTEIIRD